MPIVAINIGPFNILIGLKDEELLRQLRQRLREATPPSPSVAGVPEKHVRYVARNEWFGSLVYDREFGGYIPFDHDATNIFRLSKNKTPDQIYRLLKNALTPQSFQKFVQLCQSIDLLDVRGQFTGVFIDSPLSTHGLVSAPTRVHLACTKACNFRCRHCFSSSGNPYPDELTTVEVKRLIDELAALGCFQLSLGGGEPLVRRDLAAIIEHANFRGVHVEISTNAVAATREVSIR